MDRVVRLLSFWINSIIPEAPVAKKRRKRDCYSTLWVPHLPTNKVRPTLQAIEHYAGGKRGLASARILPGSATTLELTWVASASYNSVFAWCSTTLEADFDWVLECLADTEALQCRLFWGLHSRPGIEQFRPIVKSLTRFRGPTVKSLDVWLPESLDGDAVFLGQGSNTQSHKIHQFDETESSKHNGVDDALRFQGMSKLCLCSDSAFVGPVSVERLGGVCLFTLRPESQHQASAEIHGLFGGRMQKRVTKRHNRDSRIVQNLPESSGGKVVPTM